MSKLKEPCVVIGAKGMLGADLVRHLQESKLATIPLDIDEIDIAQADSTLHTLLKYKPGTIINAAAVTDVDGCESNRSAAFSINTEGAGNVAKAAGVCGAFMIHLSTDYVFDGTKRSPYREDDPVSPLGVYGVSKAGGETAVSSILPNNHCIVRTQWLFGLNGKNFVEAILNGAKHKKILRVVDDQTGSPTYTVDLAEAIIKLGNIGFQGVIHVTNSGSATWNQFAKKILELEKLNEVRVEPLTTNELGRPAPRPAYSVLDNENFIKLTGHGLRNWEKALAEYLRERRESMINSVQ